MTVKMKASATENKEVVKQETPDMVEVVEQPTEEAKPEQVIFPDGPTQKEVDAWKAELRKKGMPDKLTVLAVSGEDIPFIFRRLSRPEYIEILNKTRTDPKDDYNEDILDICVLWPKDWTREVRESTAGGGGTPRTVLEAILEQSGFNVIGSWII